MFGVVLTAGLLFGPGAAFAAGPAKVQVCHIPPDDPGSFHTITISQNALGAHLAHGDLAGGCFEHCESLCSDGNACTIDACVPGTEVCAAPAPVSCDDSRFCTTDSCDPSSGCIYVPVTCQAPDLCTVSACSEADQGACVDAAKSCPIGELCDLSSGFCEDPCSGVVCEPATQCQVGSCGGGECFFDPAPNGTTCDDNNPGTTGDVCTAGACAGTPTTGCAGGHRYEDKGDGTVLDCSTNLYWLRNAACLTGGVWSAAQTKAATLNSGECGLADGSLEGDWRLPTKEEFCSTGVAGLCPAANASNSLVKVGCTPATVSDTTGTGCWTAGDPFVGVQQGIVYGFWSSTEAGLVNAWRAFLIGVTGGGIGTNDKGATFFTWPVRAPLPGQ